MKNAIILNGTAYEVVRTRSIAGLGPDPCELCDKTMRRICENGSLQPCDLFHRGNDLAHFKKVKNK